MKFASSAQVFRCRGLTISTPDDSSLTEAMINPNDVELLIFDLDGTILSATKPVFEAIKRAFSRLNIPLDIGSDKIEEYFGVPSDDFYRNITPLKHRSRWEEIRSNVQAEYDSTLREHARAFPGMTETLETLKKSGYRLVLYSNSSVSYFNSAISALNIRDYIDYKECVKENNLSKTELIKKIMGNFGNPVTAVIGDRFHDIKSARANNALSIGCLYGYGGQEPEEADISIASPAVLLDIFNRKIPIFSDILNEIKRRKHQERAFVVGINGIDVSGKTVFADSLEKFFIANNYRTQVINLDSFHKPKKDRYSCKNQIENYYHNSFDIATIVKKLLIPTRQRSNYSINITLLDLHTDKYEIEKNYSFDQNTIVIFEGVFLFRKELSPYIDYMIFLDIPFEEGKNRAITRDVPIYGEEILTRYEEKYFPAQRRYLEEYPPSKIADMIIDNSNWNFPVINYYR